MDFQRKYLSLTSTPINNIDTGVTTDNNNNTCISSNLNLGRVASITSSTISQNDVHGGTPIIKNGVRSYSTFATTKLYHQTFEEVQQTPCGDDVYPFCFQLAVDGTPIASGGVGNKSITPVNARFLQVKSKAALNDEDNCSLVGFSPSFTVSMIIIVKTIIIIWMIIIYVIIIIITDDNYSSQNNYHNMIIIYVIIIIITDDNYLC